MTETQNKLIKLIERLTEKNGYAPTIQELADERGVSVNAIAEMLKRLKKSGHVTWVENVARTLRVVK